MSRVRPLAWILLAACVALLALSFILDPTPATHVLERGRTVTVQHDNAVDHAITASRLAGIALLIAGAYLGYRNVRPDELVVDDELPPLDLRPLRRHHPARARRPLELAAQDRVTVLAVVVFAVLAAVTAYLYVAKRPR